MAVHSETFDARTKGKGTYEITDEVQGIIAQSKIAAGTATVFVRHTSCSLVIMENAAPAARRDLENFFERLVPEDAEYEHDDEGPDDSTSHIGWRSREPAKSFRSRTESSNSESGREFFYSSTAAPRTTARSWSR